MGYLLVDGRNLLWRSAWTAKYLSAQMGGRDVITGGVYGALSSLLRVHELCGGTTFLAWEGVKGENFRKTLYPEYKKRDKPNDELRQFLESLDDQEKRLKIVLRSCGVSQYSGVNVEADDVIGTLAKRHGKEHEVRIFSNDSDLMQLVTGNVTVVAPKKDGDTFFTPDLVKSSFGIPPERIPDFKALAGDSSDGIPGIRGIGPKTAAKLLTTGGIERLIRVVKRQPDNAAYRKLKGREDDLRLFLKLTTIQTDARLRVIPAARDRDRLTMLLRKYKFRTLIPKADRLLALGVKTG